MHRRRSQAGFTLVELMIVVAMVGVLAALATYGVRRYVLHAKTTEAMEMLRAIKEAQELYRQETFTYLATSAAVGGSYFPFGTTFPVGGVKKGFQCPTTCGGAAVQAAWNTLNVTTNHPVQFGYEVLAGATGVNAPLHPQWTGANPNFPDPPGDIWYVAYASADLNSNGKAAVFAGTSFTSEILSDPNGD
jgi:type IV pilus assembly protein PilA